MIATPKTAYTEQADGRACEKCRSFGVMKGTTTICRYDPPRVFVFQTPVPTIQGTMEFKNSTVTAWPLVEAGEWCQKFERRPDA